MELSDLTTLRYVAAASVKLGIIVAAVSGVVYLTAPRHAPQTQTVCHVVTVPNP